MRSQHAPELSVIFTASVICCLLKSVYPAIRTSLAIILTTALAVWLTKERSSHASISHKTASFSGYDLSESVDRIRDWYAFDVSCQGTVPQAIRCALEAQDYEDAIRNAISIGGDSDTVACITGGIAEAMYGLPIEIMEQARSYLPEEMIEIVDRYMEYEEWFSENKFRKYG